MTRLGNMIQTGNTRPPTPADADGSSPLSRKLSGGRRGETVEVPVIGTVRIELLGAIAWAEVEAQAFADLKAAGLELSLLTAEIFEMSRARRTLAIACRDPGRHAEPFGSLEEWGEIDPTVINVAWQLYGDVKERLDPMSIALSDDERVAITLAVKKKDAVLLRSFGVTKLSAWLATADGLLSTSAPPSSPSSDS